MGLYIIPLNFFVEVKSIEISHIGRTVGDIKNKILCLCFGIHVFYCFQTSQLIEVELFIWDYFSI